MLHIKSETKKNGDAPSIISTNEGCTHLPRYNVSSNHSSAKMLEIMKFEYKNLKALKTIGE
jgi:hypothetical protein